MEENAESKELQIRKLEATVKSLSEELIKVCQFVCLCSKLTVFILQAQVLGPWSTESLLYLLDRDLCCCLGICWNHWHSLGSLPQVPPRLARGPLLP